MRGWRAGASRLQCRGRDGARVTRRGRVGASVGCGPRASRSVERRCRLPQEELYPEGPWALTAIRPDGPTITKVFTPDDGERASGVPEGAQRGTQHLLLGERAAAGHRQEGDEGRHRPRAVPSRRHRRHRRRDAGGGEGEGARGARCLRAEADRDRRLGRRRSGALAARRARHAQRYGRGPRRDRVAQQGARQAARGRQECVERRPRPKASGNDEPPEQEEAGEGADGLRGASRSRRRRRRTRSTRSCGGGARVARGRARRDERTGASSANGSERRGAPGRAGRGPLRQVLQGRRERDRRRDDAPTSSRLSPTRTPRAAPRSSSPRDGFGRRSTEHGPRSRRPGRRPRTR